MHQLQADLTTGQGPLFLRFMHPLLIEAPAKINLFLRVGGRRPDGFHEILSLMQAVSLTDRISLEPRADANSDELETSGVEARALGNSENIVMDALSALRRRVPSLAFLKVRLEKNIPVGAGLGGGSSDAGSLLRKIAAERELGLSATDLAQIALELGSDVTFFLGSGSSLASGRGEVLHPLELALDYWVVLVTPATRMSTAAAYNSLSRPQKNLLTNEDLADRITRYSSTQRLSELLAELIVEENDFELSYLRSIDGNPAVATFVREIQEIRVRLRQAGAALVRMSGSGSTIFGIFTSAPDAQTLQDLRRADWRTHLCRPVRLPLVPH